MTKHKKRWQHLLGSCFDKYEQMNPTLINPYPNPNLFHNLNLNSYPNSYKNQCWEGIFAAIFFAVSA